MRVGVDLPYFAHAVEIRDYVQAAQGLGYAHIGFSEHIVSSSASPFPPGLSFDEPWHESFTLLAFLAAITEDIELNTGMTLLTLRPAALAAKQAAEVDLLSGGRLRLGVSVGWQHREMEAVGVEPSTRGARIEEQIEAMRLLWTQPLVTYHGKHVVLDEVALHPRPDRSIPIWMGGGNFDTGRHAAGGHDHARRATRRRLQDDGPTRHRPRCRPEIRGSNARRGGGRRTRR